MKVLAGFFIFLLLLWLIGIGFLIDEAADAHARERREKFLDDDGPEAPMNTRTHAHPGVARYRGGNRG